jgi:hypothetical protein
MTSGQTVRTTNSLTKGPEQHIRSPEIDCGISGDIHNGEGSMGSKPAR